MKFVSSKLMLGRTKDECIYEHSEFMEKIILMDKSLYKYYKKYYNKNIYFHPLKFLKYLELKRAIKNNTIQCYINTYLNNNQGWIDSHFIPKDKNGRVLEIVNYFGRKLKVKLYGYGFHEISDNGMTMFGWTCWVQRWRFLDDKSKEIEEVEYVKKEKRK